MTPKLPSKPKFLDVRKGFEYVEPESKKLPPVFDSIVENVKNLERQSYELSNVRATLLVNFTGDANAANITGVKIEDAERLSTLALLVCVLEKLTDKVSKCTNTNAKS